MTLKTRRILSLIFLILFLILTPAIMFYAAGYRLGRNGFSFQRTGMLIIDSKPRGAKIFLNNRAQKDFLSSLFGKNNFITTPAKIKNLLPGEYNVRVELGGFWSWQKKLTVEPGASTFAENIYLFRNDLPAQATSAEIQAQSLSPDKRQFLTLSPGQIGFLNLAEGTELSVKQTGLTGKAIAWTSDSRKVMVDGHLYDLNDLNQPTDLSRLAPGGFNYKWDGDTLYWRDQAAIYRQNGDNQAEKIIGNRKFNDYLIKGGYLYLIAKSGPAASLQIFSLFDMAMQKNISLPASANYGFINPEQNLLNVYDRDHSILYLINLFAVYNSPFIDAIRDVKIADWTAGGNLLYANDFEIWLYDPAGKARSLITRISSQINQAIMHPSKNYIIFSTDKTVAVIELDDREKRNITELLKFDSIGPMALSPQGDVLYFSGRVGNSQGLFKLLIQ